MTTGQLYNIIYTDRGIYFQYRILKGEIFLQVIPECSDERIMKAWDKTQEAISRMRLDNPPPRSDLAIDEADVHICLWEKGCKSQCGFCYLRSPKGRNVEPTVFEQCSIHENIFFIGFEDMLKTMVNLRYAAGAKTIVFVGGDPCSHPHLVEFLIFAKAIGLETCVLSNTHRYLMDGQEVSIETLARFGFLDEVDVTIHGTQSKHDKFNKTPGSYEQVSWQIKKFSQARSGNQSIGVILNMTPYLIGPGGEGTYLTMASAIYPLGMEPDRDFFTIQRIAPVGLAQNNFEKKWAIDSQHLNQAFRDFEVIEQIYNVKTKACIDAFPWCAVDEEYWRYLEPLEGGCNWGNPGGVLSVLPDGMLQRCALCHHHLGVNIKSLNAPEEFTNFMSTNRMLVETRRREHLAEECKQCLLYPKCGGGCIIASTYINPISQKKIWGDPYTWTVRPVSRDYLAKGPL